MRRFSPDYLAETRRGMWDDRSALAPLDLSSRERVLDVGCGSGEFTAVVRRATDATVIGLDADPELLRTADADGLVLGDATRLPFRDDAFDLVTCQALLINLPDPDPALREFARVSSDLVAAIEPDNAAVSVDSTVAAEAPVSRRAREAYIEGVETDVTLGSDAADRLRAAGLDDVRTRLYRHRLTIDPPYSADAVDGAARKATGGRLADQRATMLSGGLSEEEFDALRDDWRAVGRETVGQMREREYRREEVIPFYVTVGRASTE